MNDSRGEKIPGRGRGEGQEGGRGRGRGNDRGRGGRGNDRGRGRGRGGGNHQEGGRGRGYDKENGGDTRGGKRGNGKQHGRGGGNKNPGKGNHYSSSPKVHQSANTSNKDQNEEIFQYFRTLKGGTLPKIVSYIAGHLELWKLLWDTAAKNDSKFSASDREALVLILTKIPLSENGLSPPIGACCSVLLHVIKGCDIAKFLPVDSLVRNAVERLLGFIWKDDVERIKTHLKSVLQPLMTKYPLLYISANADPQKMAESAQEMQDKMNIVIALLKKIDSPYQIKTAAEETIETDAIAPKNEESDWRDSTVNWLLDDKKFVAKTLKTMSSRETFSSPETYLQSVHSLWVALTWSSGYKTLQPKCTAKKQNGDMCNQDLKPMKSTKPVCKFCHGSKISSEPSVQCEMHKEHVLCGNCANEKRKELLGPPGKYACTDIYDATLNQTDIDGKLMFKNVASRRPPQASVNWRTTYRLQSPSLVGLIKLGSRGASIPRDSRIIWGEICNYAKERRDECRLREKGYLAVQVIAGQTSLEWSLSDDLAIIDCRSFVPEHLPVLNALEHQIKEMDILPFNGGELLCIGSARSGRSGAMSLHLLDSTSRYAKIENMINVLAALAKPEEALVQKLMIQTVKCSDFEPIIDIRANENYCSMLVDSLKTLVLKLTLDAGQLRSFIFSLLKPVHCIQGPPGTGKSYVGVALTIAYLEIKKIWKAVSPSIGNPPILVLSYKNHAIDEFLCDLLALSKRVNMIRVGGGSTDPKLDPYKENRYVDASAEHALFKTFQKQLKDFSLQRDNIRSMRQQISGNKWVVASLCAPEKSGFDQQLDKLYKSDYVNVLALIVVLLHQNIIFDDTSAVNTDALNTNADQAKLPKGETLLPLLYQGYSHIDPTVDCRKLLWEWIVGNTPPPKCLVTDCKNCVRSVTGADSYCQLHSCNYSGRTCSEIVYPPISYCTAHKCSKSKCPYEILADQSLCKDHCCRVCVAENRRSKPAEDAPPRNTCNEHILCIGTNFDTTEPCCNLALPTSSRGLCESHQNSVTCKFVLNDGSRCSNYTAANGESFCSDHKPLETEGICKAIAKRSKKRCQSKKIGDSDYCQDHQPKVTDNETLSNTFDSHENAEAPLPTIIDSKENTEAAKPVIIDSKESAEAPPPTVSESKENILATPSITIDSSTESATHSAEAVNDFTESPSAVGEELSSRDNIDESEYNEHQLLLREIYQEESEEEELQNDVEELLKEPQGESKEDQLQDPPSHKVIEWMLPNVWSWQLTHEQRIGLIEIAVAKFDKCLEEADRQLDTKIRQAKQSFINQKNKIRMQAYESCDLIGGTIVACITRLDVIRNTKPFAILVEEASEVSETLLFSCIVPSTKKLELIGDHFQLQASLHDNYEFELINKLHVSLFERLVKSNGGNFESLDILSIQRRMRKNICDLTREFYRDLTCIEDERTVFSRVIAGKTGVSNCISKGREVPGIGAHIFFWTHEGKQTKSHVGLSRVNSTEVSMIGALAKYLVDRGVPKSSIAVLTPYTGQLRLLQSELLKLGIYVKKDFTKKGQRIQGDTCRISTVDRFQGDESDIVLVSLVVDEHSKTPFVKLRNRMIVLLSRARIGFYLAGSKSFFSQANDDLPEHWNSTIDILKKGQVCDSHSDSSGSSCVICKKLHVYDQARIGTKIPLCCGVHSSTEFTLVSAGLPLRHKCKELCNLELSCGHLCTNNCHWPDSKHSVCTVVIPSPCETHSHLQLSCLEVINSSSKKNIKFQEAVELFVCKQKIQFRRICSHILDIFCCDEAEAINNPGILPPCKQPAIQKIRFSYCDHELSNVVCSEFEQKKRHVTENKIQCREQVNYFSACGHSCKINCYQAHLYHQAPSTFVCNEKITFCLPRCGHEVRITCDEANKIKRSFNNQPIGFKVTQIVEGVKYPARDYPCTTKVKFNRLCGHTLDVDCYVAHDYADNRSPPPCQEMTKAQNPMCLHITELECHKLQNLTPLLQTITSNPSFVAVQQVAESDSPSVHFNVQYNAGLSCSAPVKFQRLCGHSISTSCQNAFLWLQGNSAQCPPPCTDSVSLKNPLCGHSISAPCTSKAKIEQWNPWDKIDSEEAEKIMKNLSVFRLNSATASIPNQCPKDIEKFMSCKQKILVTLPCGHNSEKPCEIALKSLSKPKKCLQSIDITPSCGHSRRVQCFEKNQIFVCKHKVDRKCWNFSLCGNTQQMDCCSNDRVCCNGKYKFECSRCSSSSYKPAMYPCSKGLALECANCSLLTLDSRIENLNSLKEKIGFDSKYYVPACFANNFQTMMGAQWVWRCDKFADAVVIEQQLLSRYLQSLTQLSTDERPLATVYYIPVVVKLAPKEVACIKDENKPWMALCAKTGRTGLAVETLVLSSKIIANMKTDKEQKYWLMGLAVCCKVFCATEQLPTKKRRNKWRTQYLLEGYDSVLSGDTLYLWDPYCLYTVGILDREGLSKLEFSTTEETFAPITRYVQFQNTNTNRSQSMQQITVDSDSKATERMVTSIQKIAGSPDARCQKWVNNYVLLHSFKDGAGMNGISRDHDELLEAEMYEKLHCLNPSCSSALAGMNKLKILEKEWIESHLLLALECITSVGSCSESEGYLEQYLRNIAEFNVNAHPLIFLCKARILLSQRKHEKAEEFDEDTVLYLQSFVDAYPDSSPHRNELLTPEEIDYISSKDHTKPSSLNFHEIILGKWMDMQREFTVNSKAMTDLCNMVGLRKVKEYALSLFNARENFKKFKESQRILPALNFVFLGNPGTGKTTVARLFAQILVDTGFRKKSTIVEQSGQQLKQDGVDKFREHVKTAMDGVLFIDEAYQLDPVGDSFKGQPIVNELLTITENDRDKISFILAGYESDLQQKFFSYNEGLKSRFQEILFEDFDEKELRQIWEESLITKEWEVASEDVTNVVIHRLMKKSGKKGFGNAREVRRVLEEAIIRATNRGDGEAVIFIEDIMGLRPSKNKKLSAHTDELQQKIGWHTIKQKINELIEMAESNYDREIKGNEPLPIFKNRLFMGNPGTGKTTCAALYGKILKCLNFLSIGEVVMKTGSDFVGSVVGESQSKTNQILKQAEGKVLVIDEAYILDDNLYGKQVLDTIVEKVHGAANEDIAVIMLGYENQMRAMLRNQNPGLARRFNIDQAFKFEDYSESELLEILKFNLRKSKVQYESPVLHKMMNLLNQRRNLPKFGNAGDVETMVKAAITKAAARNRHSDYIEILPEDIEDGIDPTEDPFSELSALYKMENIRAELERLKNKIAVAKMEGDSTPSAGHFVFRGPPGTGKTTVARVTAKILFKLGYLVRPAMVQTTGQDLCAGYVGQTTAKVKEKLDEANGGVLFIDEAYALGEGLFQKEALETILAAMTDPEYKALVIVIAGYKEEIETMLMRNPGLKSRFTVYLDFDNWDPKDCLEYLRSVYTKMKFQLEINRDTETEILELFKTLISLPGWANGRDVMAIYEKSRSIRADRIAASNELARKVMISSDIVAAIRGVINNRNVPITKPPDTQSTNNLPLMQTQSSSQPIQRKQETVQSKTVQPQTPEPNSENNLSQQPKLAKRDDGVTDEQWSELEASRERHKKREIEMEKERMAIEQELERLEKIRIKQEEERKRLEEELKRQQQEKEKKERIERELKKLEEERLEREKELKRKREEELALQRERERQQAIQTRLRAIGNCPAGFAWLQVGGGWRCGGGSHFVSDSELNSKFAYDLPY